MANAKITDLAFELLHHIMLLVPHAIPTSHSSRASSPSGREWGYPLREDSDHLRKLAPLRRTCRAFDAAIQPILFSEVTLGCLYTRLDIVDHQLSCFEDNVNIVSGPWNHHTRKLRIVNLDVCYDRKPSGGGVQYWEEYFSQEQREQAEEMKTMIEQRLLQCLRNGLSKLEPLRWFIRIGDPVEELVAHFSQLPSLGSLELVFWHDKVFPDFPLDAFSNLTKIELFFFHEQDEVKIDNAWVDNARILFQRLQKVIEASPSLESLKLGKRFRHETYVDPVEAKYWPMFSSDLLLSSSSPAHCNLRHLALRRFDLVEDHAIPTTFYPRLFRNLTSLTSVDFTGCGYETERTVWRALLDSNVLLTSIRVDYVNNSLITYISKPRVPLESLTLLLERFNLDDDLDWDANVNLARRMYTTVLEAHSGRLKHLDVQASGQTFWWLECLTHPSQPQEVPASSTSPAPAHAAAPSNVESASFIIDAATLGGDSEEPFEPRDTPVLLEETSLFQCQQLRSLGLVIDLQRALTATKLSLVPGAIEKRVTAFLKQMLARMPQLDTVTIYRPERFASGIFSDEAREKTREAIQDFIVTEKDRTDAPFNVIFEESRYELRRGTEFAGEEEEGNSSLQWKFVDINAESGEEVWEEEDWEEVDEGDREAFNAQVRDELPSLF